jgi:hypothetical protein
MEVHIDQVSSELDRVACDRQADRQMQSLTGSHVE